MKASPFQWSHAPQFSMAQFVVACAVPGLIAAFGFHVVLPTLHQNGVPAIVGWPLVASAMLAVFCALPIVLMKREATGLRISLAQRMALRSIPARWWGLSLVLLILGVGVSAAMSPVSAFLTTTPWLAVPEYYPFFLDPTINPFETSRAALTPGFDMQGAYWVVVLLSVTLLLNVCFEELYFRAWLLPKMHALGATSWLLNGVGFAFYHVFQLWLLPQILPLSLCMAYVTYKTRSILPAIVVHLLANTLSILSILALSGS